MTVQLTKEQIDAIKVELRKYGLNVLLLPGKRGRHIRNTAKALPRVDDLQARIAQVRAMHFKTAGAKARIIKTLQLAKRCRDYHAANPYDLGALLAMFGVRLQNVNPWPEGEGHGQRWRALANAKVKALPAPSTPSEPRYYGHAHTRVRQELEPETS